MNNIVEILERHQNWSDVLFVTRIAKANQRPDGKYNVWPLTTTDLESAGLARTRLIEALKELKCRGYQANADTSQWWHKDDPDRALGIEQVIEIEWGDGAS